MIYQPENRFLALILYLAALVLMVGCASGGGGQGSQTDAFPGTAEKELEEGRDQGGSRIWHVTDDGEPPVKLEPFILEPEDSMAGEGEYFGPYFDDTVEPIWKRIEELVFWYSQIQLAGDTPPAFTSVSAFISVLPVLPGLCDYAHVGLYYGEGRCARGRDIQDGVLLVGEFGLDFGFRTYLTSEHTLFGIYWMWGFKTGWLFWEYPDPEAMPVQAGTEKPTARDAVGAITPYLGLGVSFLQTKRAHLGVNISVGYRATKETTELEFDNNIFYPPVAEYKLNFEVKFPVK
jgi:hypothetical protein